MTKTNYEVVKEYAIAAGGIAGGIAATYFTTIYLPARIISTTTVATTAAMNATLGSTVAAWFSGTVADTATVAGAEAYVAAKSTGFVGTSASAVLGSFTMGSVAGAKAVEYTLKGVEKVYEGISSVASWTKKIDYEGITKKLEVSA